MHTPLLISFFIFFVFLVPLRITLMTGFIAAIAVAVVMFSAHAIAGVKATIGQALRAIGLSLFFLSVAVFTVFRFSAFSGVHEFRDLGAVAVFAFLFAAYSLGFSIVLEVTFVASLLVAALATTLSGIIFLVGRSFI